VAKKKRQPARRPIPTAPDLRDALDQVETLCERGHWDRARERVEGLLRTHPRHPELLEKVLEVAAAVEDAPIYQRACELLFALRPDDRDLPYMLTSAYIQNRWLGLALPMARRALARDPAHEKAAVTRKAIAEMEPLVNEEITRLGLGGPDALECLTLHEQGRSYLGQALFDRAHQVAEALLKRRPHFSPAYNNGAEACYHAGRVAQAIDLEQRLLKFDPDNVFGLSNLVRFLCATGKMEEARKHAQRLKANRAPVVDQAIKQAEALSWLGDDAGVLEVFDQARQLQGDTEPEEDAMLYHLAAVAAYRRGREEQALTCWRFALRDLPDFELARSNLDDLLRPISERNAPWSYPFIYYVPRQLIDGLLEQMQSAGGKGDKGAIREAKRYLQGHPELAGLVPLLLDRSDQSGRELALHLARLLHTPAILEAVRDFALGQRGPDRLRLQAAELAAQAGLIPDGPTRLWLDGEWRSTITQRSEIHTEPVQRTHAPGVFELITQGGEALFAGYYARAERILRQALAIDPTDPVVLNNLAVACANQGRIDESEALSIRLHELHPDYLFGRTALANLASERGDFERARQLLEPLRERKRLHISEFSSLCISHLNLYLAEGDLQQARHWLGMWRQAEPDNPLIRSYEERLRQ
jgi:tetratricopeptide (TPR) repeat protein